MKIYIGTDHTGFELKEELKKFLEDLGYEVEDKGAYEFSATDDYPDFVCPAVKECFQHKYKKYSKHLFQAVTDGVGKIDSIIL
jgi:ribose 5-phosphate isomerase RpiB